MMVSYDNVQKQLLASPKTWLITGVAGFIGSNLLEALLRLNQRVIGLDNFSTGFECNLREVSELVDSTQWGNFRFLEGDIRVLQDCQAACDGVDYVLHHAAIGSVPRSIEDPINTNANNIDGFVNMLVASRDSKVKNFVYAASSSTYGDHQELPKIEERIGRPLSPYAVTKLVNEIYAEVFGRNYGSKTVGLRYFNVFGRRQNPDGAYAAVIPKWISSIIKGEQVFINGDGETSRDFCHVDNVIQANLLAATKENDEALNQIYNVAVGDRTTLNELYQIIMGELALCHGVSENKPEHRDFRDGDVRHSMADITKARKNLYYEPYYSIRKGIQESMSWYVEKLAK